MVQDFLLLIYIYPDFAVYAKRESIATVVGEFLLYTPVHPDFVVYIFVGHDARTLRTVNVLLKVSDIVSYCK